MESPGCEQHPHSITEQHTFTDGRTKLVDGEPTRGESKGADCLLRYTGDFAIGVVEVKPEGAREGTGLQQSKDCAEIRGLKFAFATDGHWIFEFDFMTATPLRKDNRDTYRYFGNPIYTFSLKQGVDDGFLAPYRVHRVIAL